MSGQNWLRSKSVSDSIKQWAQNSCTRYRWILFVVERFKHIAHKRSAFLCFESGRFHFFIVLLQYDSARLFNLILDLIKVPVNPTFFRAHYIALYFLVEFTHSPFHQNVLSQQHLRPLSAWRLPPSPNRRRPKRDWQILCFLSHTELIPQKQHLLR